MVTFGLDISHHQDIKLDLAQCRREGVEFVFIKATEGSGFVDSDFKPNLAEARAAGQLVAAYHYVKDNATSTAQVQNVLRTVPKDVPVIPDVEANSGGIQLTRDFVSALRSAGYSVPLLYLPRWYWQQIGSPDLRGLPSLWSSRYPDKTQRSLEAGLAAVPASYWNGYGNLDVAVLQFTSTAKVAGYAPLDANAFRGTRDQLAELLGGEDMTFEQSDRDAATAMQWRFYCAMRGMGVIPATTDMGAPPKNLVGQKIEQNLAIAAANTAIAKLQADVAELKTGGTPVPVDLDYDQLVNDVVERLADRLNTLRFVADSGDNSGTN
jgi:glycosyl hydrolase family 25